MASFDKKAWFVSDECCLGKLHHITNGIFWQKSMIRFWRMLSCQIASHNKWHLLTKKHDSFLTNAVLSNCISIQMASFDKKAWFVSDECCLAKLHLITNGIYSQKSMIRFWRMLSCQIASQYKWHLLTKKHDSFLTNAVLSNCIS